MERYDADLLVVGSGPGGYVAAIRAAQLGMKVTLVEKDKPGGVCLNVGCIPSKALIHQAELYSSIAGLEKIGIACDKSGFDYSKVQASSRLAADKLSKGVSFLLEKNKIKLVMGEASLSGPHGIKLQDGRHLTGRNIIVATGSRPRQLPGWDYDEARILSSTGILMMKSLPKRLLIIGSGAIGVEFAHIMNAFGVEVTLVEILDSILPIEDREIAEVLFQSLRKRGIRIHTSTKAALASDEGSFLKVSLESASGEKSIIEVDKVLVSAGRIPNTEKLGWETIGVTPDSGGYIPIGDGYRTACESIYAIGDIIRSPQLAHVASKEGEIAVEFMAGLHFLGNLDSTRIPGATYCVPEIASFGPTEAALKKENREYKKSAFPFQAVGKAIATEASQGMIKLLTDTITGEILSCHIVGPQATELIHEVLLAANSELLPLDVANMVHAHPTLSEGLMEVMRMVDGKAVHI